MKKAATIVALGVIAAMSVSSFCMVNAETLPEVTMEQICDANLRENFLKDGGSYQTEITFHAGTADENTEIAYSDAEMRSLTWVYPDGESAQITVGNVGCGIYEGEYEFYLIADENWTKNNQPVFINCLDKMSTEDETIEECVQDGDHLIVKTALSAEGTKSMLEKYGDTWEEGDVMKVTYTVDAQTYALIEEVSTVEKADGTVEKLGSVKVNFDPERPEGADEMYRFFAESENRHTVTIILDPGTENEKKFSADMPQGVPVYAILPEGYEALYTDAECTQKLEDYMDENEDVVVYSVKKAEE